MMISILMPAYNAAKYIAEAINSVLQQTYNDWELIIVDDKSTDNTFDIITVFANKDCRIKIYQLENNSGSAQRPRLTAEKLAQGAFICQLDADDVLEKRYLEKLIQRQEETQADAVIGRLCKMSDKGIKYPPFNPIKNFNLDSIITGREAFMRTVGSWEINGLGIFKKEVFGKIHNRIEFDSINADEVYTRLKFLSCSIVAFSNADYYYRVNLESITQKFSTKLFDSLDAINEVRILTLNEFGSNSTEYIKAVSHHFSSILSYISLFHNRNNEIEYKDRLIIKNKIHYNWKQLSIIDVFKASLKKGMLHSCGFHIIFIASFLKKYVKRK